MAEASADNTDQRCADSDTDFLCTPCSEDGVTETATKYCPVCKEYLCASCVKYHRKFSATRSHLLVNREEALSSTSSQTSAKAKFMCRLHPSAEITNFCKEHDAVFCSLCAVADHRHCKGLSTVAEAVSGGSAIDSESSLKDINHCQAKLWKTQQKMEDNTNKVDDETAKFSNEIEETRQQLAEKINQLCNKARDELNTKANQIKEKLGQCVSLIQAMSKELKNISSEVSESKGADQMEKFIYRKNSKQLVSQAQRLNEHVESEPTRQLRCHRNSQLIDQIVQAPSLMSVTCEEKGEKSYAAEPTVQGSSSESVAGQENTNRSYSVAATRKISVKMQDEQGNFFMSDLCETTDGRIIIADYYHKKLKIFDGQLIFITSRDLKARPVGVCCTDNETFAVKLTSNILTLYDSQTLQETSQFPIRQGGLLGLAYCKRLFWLSVREGLDVYNTSGTLVKTINNVSQSVGCQHISVAQTFDKMYVAGSSNSFASYDLNTDSFQNSFKTEDLKNCRGVCAVPDGRIFASCQITNNIITFKEDGTCLGKLLPTDQCLNKPVALLYDAKKHRLLVTGYESKFIQVIEFA